MSNHQYAYAHLHCNAIASLIAAMQSLEQQCLTHFKEDHAVYASALNNVALMHKALQNHSKAIDLYQKVSCAAVTANDS
jgi:tetratricopeptide (TPR) repeat protein